MSRRCIIALCIGVLGPLGCVRHEVAEPSQVSKPRTLEEAAADLGNPLLASRGDINAVNVNVATSAELESVDNGSDEELIWTDPDNPDAEIPGLTDAFENRLQGNTWQLNFTNAVRMARRQEMPLVIWFHDSVLSSRSKELGEDYLNTKEFDAFCHNRVVRLRLDAGASISDTGADNAPYSYQKINALKKSYGLKEKPAVAVVSPNGRIVARLDGYDGHMPAFRAELTEGVARAEQEYRSYKEKLRARGYRDWHARRGSKSIFAKVMRVDDAKGVVYLKESGGRTSRTRLSNLSEEDVEYLDELRRKYEKQRRNRTAEEDDL